MTYSEKLRDPRWQKRRLEVMEAAGWKCVSCGDDKSTLNVHHLAYRGEPWDAPAEWLECLCERCHEWREAYNGRNGRSLTSTNGLWRLHQAHCHWDALLIPVLINMSLGDNDRVNAMLADFFSSVKNTTHVGEFCRGGARDMA